MEAVRLPAGVSVAPPEMCGGLAALVVDTPRCTALVALQGAQVLRFRAAGQPSLLWLSEQAQYVRGKAIRGGIPLCFPWFGPHPDDPAKPQHGFARNRDWQLVTATRHADDRVELGFRLVDDEDTRRLWPHAFRAELTLVLADTLHCRFVLHNTGPADCRAGFAFHSYFPVTDITQARVEGLQGARCLDQLAPPAAPLPVVADALRFAGETDRIFLGAGGRYRVVDEVGGTTVSLAADGCASVVVWNPWRDKAARMADMAPGAWRRMLCVECGNVGADQVTVPAGASCAFAMTISQ